MDQQKPRPVGREILGALAVIGILCSPLMGVPSYAVFVGVTLLLFHAIGRLIGRIEKLERLLATDELDVAELAASIRPSEIGPIEAGVRDAIAGYERAGYTSEQAKSLAREVLRMQVKDSGGWSA